MDRIKLEKMVNSLMSIGDIAKAERRSKGSVRHWISKFGIKIRNGVGGRKIPRPNCVFCGGVVGRPKNKYCSQKCQMENEYREYIRRWIKGEVSGEKYVGEVSGHVRRWLFERSGGRCESVVDGKRCNWSRVNEITGKIPLTVHHKNGNSKKHSPDNLELICPCCHSVTPTYGSLNKGNGRRGRKVLGP